MNSRAETPPWLLRASVAVLVGTLLFFMGLMLLSVFGHPIPVDSRFLVNVILALGTGFGAAGLGGYAAFKGKLPFPGADQHPIAISAGGGIAVMLIVLLASPRVIPAAITASDSSQVDLHLDSLSGTVVAENPVRLQIDAHFRRMSLSSDRRLYFAVGTLGCDTPLFRAIVDSPVVGEMTVFLRRNKSELTCGRLEVEESDGTIKQRGPVTSIEW